MNVLLAYRDLGPRMGLRRLLERLPDVRVVGETSTGAGAIRLARRRRPAVALVGSTLRRPSCLETVRSIRAFSPRTQFIVLTVRHTKAYVRAARRSGASYCIPVRTLDVRLPSLVALAFRDYLAQAAGNVPGSRRRRKDRRAQAR